MIIVSHWKAVCSGCKAKLALLRQFVSWVLVTVMLFKISNRALAKILVPVVVMVYVLIHNVNVIHIFWEKTVLFLIAKTTKFNVTAQRTVKVIIVNVLV